MRLEHVNFTVSDVDRSVAFYRDLLELKLRWRGKTADGREAAHVGDDQMYLALFEAAPKDAADATPGDSRGEPDYGRVGLNHIGFVVDDLAVMKRRLADVGITPHFEPVYEPGRRLYFFDRDGIEVEL
ncbi:MAG: VOC family protein, partial [Phycisphaerae bacterium]